MSRGLVRTLLLALALLAAARAGAAQPTSLRLVWAGDPEGGAPYVEADPNNPDRLVGFDVELADLLARGLGRRAQFTFITFSSIAQGVARGDADLGLSGAESPEAIESNAAVKARVEEGFWNLARQMQAMATGSEDVVLPDGLAELQSQRPVVQMYPPPVLTTTRWYRVPPTGRRKWRGGCAPAPTSRSPQGRRRCPTFRH